LKAPIMRVFASIRYVLVAMVAIIGIANISAFAEGAGPLYRASVIVTGAREETRYPAIAQCFEMVMAKVTGNPDISANPAFADWASRARAFVWSYTYHDRLFGRQIHDEQGTRDRPFDLTVQFDDKMIAAAAAAMGEKLWPEPRPSLAIVVGVNNNFRTYVLAKGQELGSDQRAAFEDASTRFGVPIVFPSVEQLAAAGISYENIMRADSQNLSGLAKTVGAHAALIGHLDWRDNDHGWIGTWHLNRGTGSPAWSIRGVNFDAAFRDAVGGAAKLLSKSQIAIR
jgi:uncharacterized protein